MTSMSGGRHLRGRRVLVRPSVSSTATYRRLLRRSGNGQSPQHGQGKQEQNMHAQISLRIGQDACCRACRDALS